MRCTLPVELRAGPGSIVKIPDQVRTLISAIHPIDFIVNGERVDGGIDAASDQACRTSGRVVLDMVFDGAEVKGFRPTPWVRDALSLLVERATRTMTAFQVCHWFLASESVF